MFGHKLALGTSRKIDLPVPLRVVVPGSDHQLAHECSGGQIAVAPVWDSLDHHITESDSILNAGRPRQRPNLGDKIAQARWTTRITDRNFVSRLHKQMRQGCTDVS
jgi:hypothetical protein